MKKKQVIAAVALAGAVTVPLAQAATHPFSNTELASGYNFQHDDGAKGGGEGKCGEDPKVCPEGKCGEGKCGDECNGKADDADKAHAEGKCGEGKCGDTAPRQDKPL